MKNDKIILYRNINSQVLDYKVRLLEDQLFIRESLNAKGLVAFIGNGSILPRESGVSSKPLKNGKMLL